MMPPQEFMDYSLEKARKAGAIFQDRGFRIEAPCAPEQRTTRIFFGEKYPYNVLCSVYSVLFFAGQGSEEREFSRMAIGLEHGLNRENFPAGAVAYLRAGAEYPDFSVLCNLLSGKIEDMQMASFLREEKWLVRMHRAIHRPVFAHEIGKRADYPLIAPALGTFIVNACVYAKRLSSACVL